MQVDRALYEQLGVEPRQLASVTRMKYRNGEAFYLAPHGDDLARRNHKIDHINKIERP